MIQAALDSAQGDSLKWNLYAEDIVDIYEALKNAVRNKDT